MDKVGNVVMNYEFYNGSDDYSDGDIENELLDYVSSNENVIDVLKQENRWPILYHLSPIRENILEWYDFKADASVLEIGAGCGAVTGVLCRNVKSVTSVELSKRRALINANRNKKYNNLDIIVGNFNDIKFTKKYDYITLIGVLEYADYFTSGNNSFVSFLEKIKGLLKEDGKLLIAIENKFGLKYFSGQVEDHTGKLFDGIEGYVGTDSKVRTFSKDELMKTVVSAGLPEVKFFYPFPDYKFPTQIFSDKYLPKEEDVVCGIDSYDNDRVRLFDETAAFANVVKAGKFDYFSNSFFVEAGFNKLSDTIEKVYSKITKDRKEEFQIETAIYYNNESKEFTAAKKAVNEKAKNHISKMYDEYKNSVENTAHSSASLCKSEYSNNTIKFEFVKGKSLCDKLLDELEYGNKKAFEKLLFEYQNIVYDIAAKKDNKGLNVDLTFDNIIEVNNGEYKVIDYEWCMDSDIPIKYIFYRAIFAFYMRYQDTVIKHYSLRNLYDLFEISKDEEEKYSKMNEEFIDYVYDSQNGYNQMLKKYKKRVIPFEYRVMYHDYFTQLFYDKGNGINEEDSIKKSINADNNYQIITFNIPDCDITSLRFDPLNIPAVVKLREIYALDEQDNKVEVNILSHNAVIKSVYSYMFENDDPQILIEMPSVKIKKLVIKLKISQTDFEKFHEFRRLSDLRIFKDYQIEHEQLINMFKILEDNKEVLPDISKYFSVTKKLMDIEETKKNTEKNLVTFSDTYTMESQVFVKEMINLAYLRKDIENQLKQEIEEKEKLKNELEYIKSTKVYRHLLDKKVSKELGNN